MIITPIQRSDHYEANSMYKHNRGLVWIKVLTIVSSDYHSNKIEYTYPLSIGFKKLIMILSNRH